MGSKAGLRFISRSAFGRMFARRAAGELGTNMRALLSRHQSSRRKQEGHTNPAAETMGTGVGRVHPIAHAADDADRLPPTLTILETRKLTGANQPVSQM